MCVGHTHPADRRALEVKFNKHGRLVSDDPRIMFRLDSYDLWSLQFHGAAVRILNMDLAAGQKAHMCVYAEIGADDRFNVTGPAKTDGVDHPLDPGRADANCIDLNTADFAVFRSGHRCQNWIGGIHVISSRSK